MLELGPVASAVTSSILDFAKAHPEFGLESHQEILAGHGIGLSTEAFEKANPSKLDGTTVLALLVASLWADHHLDGTSDGIFLHFLKSGSVRRWLVRLRALDWEAEGPAAAVEEDGALRTLILEQLDWERGFRRHSPTLRECVFGQAVGDALGVPFEFQPRGSFTCAGMVGHGSHDQPAGTWSDDTSMALATCDSIRVCGCVDVDDMRERFVRWYREDAYTVDGLFDIGGATARALVTGQGQAGERDNGNGSLMRILPLAFTAATDDEVRAVSAITHAHPISCEACVRMVHVARRLIAGEPVRDVLGELVGVPEDEIRSGGYVLHTERAALWCLANTSSYRDCVLRAVNLGGDTDTTATVAGGLAGIVYGLGGIPLEWTDALQGKDTIDACLF